jgi:hypothetical protein
MRDLLFVIWLKAGKDISKTIELVESLVVAQFETVSEGGARMVQATVAGKTFQYELPDNWSVTDFMSTLRLCYKQLMTGGATKEIVSSYSSFSVSGISKGDGDYNRSNNVLGAPGWILSDTSLGTIKIAIGSYDTDDYAWSIYNETAGDTYFRDSTFRTLEETKAILPWNVGSWTLSGSATGYPIFENVSAKNCCTTNKMSDAELESYILDSDNQVTNTVKARFAHTAGERY